MDSDIDIAHGITLRDIGEVAQDLGLSSEDICYFGGDKAKISAKKLSQLGDSQGGELVLVTAMSPTTSGEGKTTLTIGLTQALSILGRKATLCIREPSLGPVFGMKGGAAGGGYSQVLPMEDINLQFTGDIPAVTAAHNLLSALIDNHIFRGNKLNINPNKVLWRRVVDMNDRSLRRIFIGIGGSSGVAREDGFDITASSEVMAILCLASDYSDLKKRLGDILVAYTFFGEPV
ncbi:MAG: formate--tetrahydrofolate ligase, partial [Candidatus Altiarchaeales archaeon]|nr:formate--tetrahydrofolate ligase [Candidatus Altiarchaeales archaeon]